MSVFVEFFKHFLYKIPRIFTPIILSKVTEKTSIIMPISAAPKIVLANRSLCGFPCEDRNKNPEYAIRKTDKPPPIPIAQVIMNAVKACLSLTGMQPIAV